MFECNVRPLCQDFKIITDIAIQVRPLRFQFAIEKIRSVEHALISSPLDVQLAASDLTHFHKVDDISEA